ncbi:MAG TPA: 2-dehydro-3-deoxygalactonokinase [Stellaceae bacterium]|nr:2-dehydro-3-deoxygalactonokinase [Stellaceae bacterium]
MTRPMLVALDWGTTSFRAFLVGEDRQVIDRNAGPHGILQTADGDFDRAFEALVGPWLAQHGPLLTLASGMIGSRQGWVEAPYAACPAGAGDLASQLVSTTTRSGRTVWFVPGVNRREAGRAPDVMRGEEVQIIGAGALDRATDGIHLLPGTHSKWAILREGRIAWFTTFMTGELFTLLRRHSILGRLMVDAPAIDPAALNPTALDPAALDGASFARGVAFGLSTDDADGGLLRRLFSVRTLGLFDEVPATGLADYLSGLLIGCELREARRSLEAIGAAWPDRLTVTGGAGLTSAYTSALGQAGIETIRHGDEATLSGLIEIATVAGLLSTARDITPGR